MGYHPNMTLFCCSNVSVWVITNFVHCFCAPLLCLSMWAIYFTLFLELSHFQALQLNCVACSSSHPALALKSPVFSRSLDPLYQTMILEIMIWTMNSCNWDIIYSTYSKVAMKYMCVCQPACMCMSIFYI